MQGIYTHIPEINYAPREYGVAAILLFLFMVFISLVSVLNLLLLLLLLLLLSNKYFRLSWRLVSLIYCLLNTHHLS